jgi:hypothetical protein
MMVAGQQEQVVAGQSFAARIAGIGLHGQLSLSQPPAQGFAINGKQTATVGQSDQGHRTTPFVLQVPGTTTGRDTFPAVFLGQVPGVFPRKVWGRFPGQLLGLVPRKVQGKKSSGLRPGQATRA